MVAKEHPGLVHEGLQTLMGPAYQHYVVSKEYGTDIGGVQVYSQAGRVQIKTKTGYEKTEQQRR